MDWPPLPIYQREPQAPGQFAPVAPVVPPLTGISAEAINGWLAANRLNYINVAQLKAGNLRVGNYVRSTTFVAGSSGWTINADGSAEFNNLTVRGTLSTGSIAGTLTMNATTGYIQSSDFDATHGWQLGPTGLTIHVGTIDATSLSIGSTITLGAAGYIQSSDYNETLGWRLGPTGLDINVGTITLGVGSVVPWGIITGVAIDPADLAAGYKLPGAGAALPETGMTIGDLFYLTTNYKLYKYDGEGWSATVPTTDLTGTIATLQIANDAVTAAQLAVAGIDGTTGAIAALAVGTDQIAALSITAAKIAGLTITAAEIAAATITGAKIAALTITAANIAALTITAAEIAAATITGAKIAALTIEAGNIKAATITGAQIAADTIESGNIKAGTIEASDIKSGTITTTQIAALTIAAANIAAGTITADKLSITQLDALTASMGTLTVDETITMGADGIIRTAASGQRIEMGGGFFDKVSFYPSASTGATYGWITTSGTSRPTLKLYSPSNTAYPVTAYLELRCGATGDSQAEVWAPGGFTLSGTSLYCPNIYDEASVLRLDLSANWTCAGQMLIKDGAVSSPGMAFATDTNTGLMLGSNQLILVANGTAGARVWDDNVLLGPATTGYANVRADTNDVTNVTYAFYGDVDTGMQRTGANVVSLVTAGTERMRFDANGYGYLYSVRDVGNNTAMRINTTTKEFGSYASSERLKRFIVPLSDPKARRFWKPEAIDQIVPVTYVRKSTNAREIGFTAENLAEVNDLLTVGRGAGESPDEFAVLAVAVRSIQDLRERVAILEERLLALEAA